MSDLLRIFLCGLATNLFANVYSSVWKWLTKQLKVQSKKYLSGAFIKFHWLVSLYPTIKWNAMHFRPSNYNLHRFTIVICLKCLILLRCTIISRFYIYWNNNSTYIPNRVGHFLWFHFFIIRQKSNGFL